MRMESNTERMHRVLVLWLELNKLAARASSQRNGKRAAQLQPWRTEDPEMRELWQRLTAPENVLALEQWLWNSADGRPAEWARKAVEVCRERDRIRKRDLPP